MYWPLTRLGMGYAPILPALAGFPSFGSSEYGHSHPLPMNEPTLPLAKTSACCGCASSPVVRPRELERHRPPCRQAGSACGESREPTHLPSSSSPRTADVTLTFHTERAALARRLPEVFARTATDGMVWVCWPKKAAQRSARNPQGPVSDLDENLVRDLGLELGFVDVKVAAVDEVWSGLKFVRRLADRQR